MSETKKDVVFGTAIFSDRGVLDSLSLVRTPDVRVYRDYEPGVIAGRTLKSEDGKIVVETDPGRGHVALRVTLEPGAKIGRYVPSKDATRLERS